MRRSWFVYVISGACIAGCGGNVLDVGSDQRSGDGLQAPPKDGAGGASGVSDDPLTCTSGSVPHWPEPGVCPPGIDSPLVGRWQGPVGDSMFAPPYDTLTVDILAVSADGDVCGMVTYGDPLPLEAATSAEDWYPPVERGYPAIGFGQGGGPSSWGPMPGATYTILNGTAEGNHVELDNGLAEVFKSWCALQTSYAQQGLAGQCSCLPNAGASYTPSGCTIDYDGTTESRPCPQVALCLQNGVCACNADGCTAARDTPLAGSTTIVLDFEESSATGVLRAIPEFALSLTRL